jgi:tetratricopeptide (TPR) repeat protein
MQLKTPVVAWFCMSCVVLVWPARALAEDLSYVKIKHLYQEGEFENVRVELENYLEICDETTEKEASAFAYKYLGVVYASKTDGVGQAKTYFENLLNLDPDAFLGDLYVSDRVNDLFNRIKVKHQSERTAKNAGPLSATIRAGARTAWPWLLGVTVVAGAVVLYIWVITDTPEENNQHIVQTI